MASRANSGQLHFASGVSLSAGSSQANAFTSATMDGANWRGRPVRGRSRRPSMPYLLNRRRHLRTVSTCTPTVMAICAFGVSAAAASTMRARRASRCGAHAELAIRRRVASSETLSITTYGEQSIWTSPCIRLFDEDDPFVSGRPR